MYSFRSLLARLRHQQPRRPQPRSFRPTLEALEHRWVPAGTASISGTAYVDLTGNGLSADDTPQQGVQVVLLAANQGNGGHGDHGNHGNHGRHGYHEVAHTWTAADGSYSFNNLGAGNYLVVERMPHDWVRTAPAAQNTYQVSLTDGQSVTGDDFDNFHLLHTAHVRNVSFTIFDPTTGTTTTVHDLRGHTLQGDTVTANFWVRGGQPMVVSLVTYDAPGATTTAATASQLVLDTDATGTFSKGGPYSLTVTIPNNFYQIDFVAGPAIDPFGAAGSNVNYCAQHRLISADNGGTQAQASGSLAGVVSVDDTANGGGVTGASGATVTLTGVDDQNNTVNLTAITDGNGNYSFTGLAAGTYTLSVTVAAGDNSVTPTVGTLGGNASVDGTGTIESVATISVTSGASGTGYDFIELVPNNSGGGIGA